MLNAEYETIHIDEENKLSEWGTNSKGKLHQYMRFQIKFNKNIFRSK